MSDRAWWVIGALLLAAALVVIAVWGDEEAFGCTVTVTDARTGEGVGG